MGNSDNIDLDTQLLQECPLKFRSELRAPIWNNRHEQSLNENHLLNIDMCQPFGTKIS